MLHSLIIILIMAVITFAIRICPFLFFGRGNQPPKWVSTLGKLLPPACMSVLVVYCVRNVDFLSGNHGIPELLCVGVAVALHAIKRNTLLSIGVSTALYMVLVQFVFQ